MHYINSDVVKALGRVATGTYYFDHSPGWDNVVAEKAMIEGAFRRTYFAA